MVRYSLSFTSLPMPKPCKVPLLKIWLLCSYRNATHSHVAVTAEQMARDSMDGAAYTRKTSLDSTSTGSPRSGDNIWRSTFNPGRNMSVKGRDLYDHAPEGAPSVWAHVAKADHLKQLSFANIDKNGDGFIDAEELRAALGPQTDVQQLIREADKNKDGKISYFEFCELLKHS